MNVFAPFYKIGRAYRRDGVRALWQETRERLFRTCDTYWYSAELNACNPGPELDARLTLDLAHRAQTVEYLKRKDYFVQEEEDIAASQGHWYCGLRRQETVVGFCKVGFNYVYIRDFRSVFQLPKGVAFLVEYEIDKSLRGQGVGKLLISRLLKLAEGNGIARIVCHVPTWNIASTKVLESSGFIRLGRLLFFEVLGLQYYSGSIHNLLRTNSLRSRWQVSRRHGCSPAHLAP